VLGGASILSHPQEVGKWSRQAAQPIVVERLVTTDHFSTPTREVEKWAGFRMLANEGTRLEGGVTDLQ
jgi:hypothetical protein